MKYSKYISENFNLLIYFVFFFVEFTHSESITLSISNSHSVFKCFFECTYMKYDI